MQIKYGQMEYGFAAVTSPGLILNKKLARDKK